MRFEAGQCDIVVVGGGHAGIEAALAASRLGCTVRLITLNLDSVGNMPCNPSVGGSAKGQLVREIDALGGEMAKAADATYLQRRMLGRGSGPALRAPRVQSDRRRYQETMKARLEAAPRVALRQGEVVDILTQGDAVCAVVLRTGATIACKAVILATGTFLGSRVFIGEVNYEAGPDGLFGASFLTERLAALGVELRRFKTGTPSRVLRTSLDFSHMTPQHGEYDCAPMSFESPPLTGGEELCWLTNTTEETHAIIRANLHRSPLFGGDIQGVGPRY